MKTEITLYCPCCKGTNIRKNGTKSYGKQNYLCKDCHRQFVGDHNLTYRGCHSQADKNIWKMTVRRCGIRDICAITGYSRDKIQAALKRNQHQIIPKQKHYSTLEIDEFHTFIGKKVNKVWLIYAYCKRTGEIVAFTWGKRDLTTVLQLKQRLKELRITYDRIASDDWAAFLNAFSDMPEHWVGKQHTVGIEGNNCRLRHRMSRAIRRSCCFSKSLFYHLKVFNLGFFYINYDTI